MRSHLRRQTLPGIGIVGLLALSGVFVGRALGSDEAESGVAAGRIITEVDVPTVDVPIIGPIGAGDEPPAETEPSDPTVGLGAIVGSLAVPTIDLVADAAIEPPPGTGVVDLTAEPTEPPGGWAEPVVLDDGLGVGGVVPVGAAEAIAALEPPGTPIAPLPDTDTGTVGSIGDGVDAGGDVLDPCAPPEGTPPPEGCPTGLRSTVLALTSPPPLWVLGGPVHSIAPEPRAASCDAATPEDDRLLLEMFANAPGTFTFTIYPFPAGVAPGGARVPLTIVSFDTAAEDREAWQAQLAADVPGDYRIRHCAGIDGLPEGERVLWVFTFVDDFGRTSVGNGYALPGPDPVRPPTIVLPVSSSQVFVSVPHRSDQTVDIRAWVSDDSSECRSGGTELIRTLSSTDDVDIARLHANGYIDTFTRRTWAVIVVPESATGVICMRTYDTRGPSFVTRRPLLTEVVNVHAPDLVVPIVSVDSVQALRTIGPADLSVSIRRVGGDGCGGYTGEISGGTLREVSNFACDPTLDPARAASGVTEPIVVNTTLRLEGQDARTASTIIGARARPCTGGDPAAGVAAACPHPGTDWFRVPFATVSVSTGLCSPGLFESTCEPPHRDEIAGLATVKVDWEQGATSGRSGWVVEPIATTPRSTGLDPLPQLDRSDVLRATGADTAPRIVGTLIADRAVTWSLEVPSTACLRTDGPRIFTSTVPSTTFDVYLADLCPGQQLQLVVTITDPTTGLSTVWGRYDVPNGTGWSFGLVDVPAPIRRSLVVLGATPPAEGGLWTASSLELTMSWRPGEVGWRFDFPTALTRDPAFACRQGPERYVDLYGTSRTAFVPLQVPDRTFVEVSATFVSASGTVDGCEPNGVRRRTVQFTAELTYDEITQPGGVRITAPAGSAFPVVLLIRPTP